MNSIKLICFDLDQTLITHSSWKELGYGLGISYEEDMALFQEYEAGHLTYEEWNMEVLKRYMKHSDATRKGITKILSRYSYTDGAREAVDYLKSKGYTLALISGSIDILVDMVAKDLGIEYSWANNTFVFDQNETLVDITCVGSEVSAKADYLEHLAEKLGIAIEACSCIADGANDSEMFRRTKHGITFPGSPIEKDSWKVISSFSELHTLF